jgi:multiple sugar transport system substrate-binding protein
MMIQMLAQKGAGYSTSNAEIQIFNDTTKEILYEISDHAATKAFSTFKISSYPGNFFNAGQCIFAIDSTAGASWIGPNAPLIDISEDKLVDFETAVMTIPQYNTEAPKMISQGPSVCIFNKENTQEVLASWFFVQYLLTNEVQINYAKTEGYVPVTTKAQGSDEYKEYLSRRGEDNDTYYSVKIDAAKLLIDNVDHTFTTPVFSGSASLRDAAGQMIEEVTKARRRNKTVNDAFIETLYKDMTSLYKLDQVKPVEIVEETETGTDAVTE